MRKILKNISTSIIQGPSVTQTFTYSYCNQAKYTNFQKI